MLKPNRVELVGRICEKLSLPPGQETPGYFTREQLLELAAVVDKWTTKVKELEEKIDVALRESRKS